MCKVSLLLSALNAKYPYYLVLNTQILYHVLLYMQIPAAAPAQGTQTQSRANECSQYRPGLSPTTLRPTRLVLGGEVGSILKAL